MAFKMKGFPKHRVKSAFKQKDEKPTKELARTYKGDKKNIEDMTEEEVKKVIDRNVPKILSKYHEGEGVLETRQDSMRRAGLRLQELEDKKSPAKSRKRKLKKGKTLKTEHKDTWVYKGENFREKIVDLEDRIGFIKEDIFNQKGGATAKQNKDIKAMEKRIASLKKQRDKDTDKYSQLNPKNPERD